MTFARPPERRYSARNSQIGVAPRDLCECEVAGGCLGDLVAVLAESESEHPHGLGVILDEQDPSHDGSVGRDRPGQALVWTGNGTANASS